MYCSSNWRPLVGMRARARVRAGARAGARARARVRDRVRDRTSSSPVGMDRARAIVGGVQAR